MKSFLKKYYASLGQFRALYLISAIELLVMVSYSAYTGAGMRLHPDTPYYYDSYDTIMTGHIDAARTPLYPLVIGIFRDVFGSTMSIAVVYIFQSIVFLFSIKWIGRTLGNITRHRRIAYWFTAVYAIYPGILSFCGIILTESLAVSLVSAVLYLVSEAYFRNSYRMAFLSGTACTLLWLLRPSMMAIPVILAMMWMVLMVFDSKNIRRTALWGFMSTILSIGLLWLYIFGFYKEYDKASVTLISTINNYVTIRSAKIIDVAGIESTDIRTDVDSIIRVNGIDCPGRYWWKEAFELNGKHGLVEFDRFVQCQLKQHPKDLIRFLYRDRLNLLLSYSCVYTGGATPPLFGSFTRLIQVNNGTALLILLIGVSLLTRRDLKQRRLSYIEWTLFAIFIANYFIVWVGAPNDFARLLAQNYPVLIAISCWVLDRLCTLTISSKHLHKEYAKPISHNYCDE